MSVEELIEELKKFSPTARVRISPEDDNLMEQEIVQLLYEHGVVIIETEDE